MKIGIIIFPGSNCDRDIHDALHLITGHKPIYIWHNEPAPTDLDLFIVPGGFSYGDYLRAGAIARFAVAMNSLSEHVKRGGMAIGICNGFQILCEAGLLPGALIKNQQLKHLAIDTALKAVSGNPFTAGLDASQEYIIPINHSDGNYRAQPDVLKKMEDNNQIAFRYVENHNGSVDSIAGVTDEKQRVLGMMPHPERAVDPLTGGTDGRALLDSFLNHALAVTA